MDFPGHFQHIFQQLNLQRLHAQLCDCVVVVGGQKFQAHRSILSACSSHFRALLSSSDGGDEVGGLDKGTAWGPSVMALDPEVVTPEAFATLLDMIYTSTLSLGASNVMDVLLAASHLHLNAVVKACKLHLSRKNFPALPPKGWRMLQQQRPPAIISGAERELCDEGVEVSQSGGTDDEEVTWRARGEQIPATSLSHKRKSNEDPCGGRKRSGQMHAACGSTGNPEGRGEELLASERLTSADELWENQGKKETEEKYEATKGEAEEFQLPSQSDGGAGAAWETGGDPDGDAVVKVKVGDEGDDTQMVMIEVKKENLSSCFQDVTTLASDATESPKESTRPTEKPASVEQSASAGPKGGDLQSQLCSDLSEREVGDAGEGSVDGDGLDGLSELAFSCFLNPGGETEMGALEEEDDSLSSLTAAAAAAASEAPAAPGDENQMCQNSSSSSQASDPTSSLAFPVTSVPLQQLLPTQSPNFSDAFILQPAQSSLAGIFSNVNPGLSLEASLLQPCKASKSRGTGGSSGTGFRRIAPKVSPGGEAEPPSSSGSAGEYADPQPLTRASEDVLSKCKKAAAEDHVLLVQGEKKYACKICCKTFMNLTDCKKHIRVHTGEKPYPCPKCGKRFSQSSHLYKHSKNATCLNWREEHLFQEALH